MAKRKEVLLIKDVLKLGNMGDIVRVSSGFARNYLYPFGMAVPAEGAAKRQIEVLRDKAAKSEAEREQKAVAQKKTMEGMTVQVAARVAHEIELFGSIGTKEITAALAKKGVVIDGKQIHLHDKIRRLGVYQIEVRLHKSVPVSIKLEVINSDPNAPSLQETLAQVAADRQAAAQKAAEAKTADKGGEKAAEGEPAAEAAAKGGKAGKDADKAEKGEKAPADAEGKEGKKAKGKHAKDEGQGKGKDKDGAREAHEGRPGKKDSAKADGAKKTVKV